MIEHPNLCFGLHRTIAVRILMDAQAGMLRLRPLRGCGTPPANVLGTGFKNPDPFTALFTTPHDERRTQRTQWVTRVPVRAGTPPGWLVRELPTSGRLHGGTKARETGSQGRL